MMKISKLFMASFLTLISLGLAGCHPFIKYPHPTYLSKSAAAGVVGGSAIGAQVGEAAGTSVAGATGIGALVGLGVGSYIYSETRLLAILQKEGVQVVQYGNNVRIIIPSDKIFWGGDTAIIIPQHEYILSHVIDFIRNYGSVYITVSGYTDLVGPTLYNKKLTLAQAKSVAGYFWTRGIAFDHLRPMGYGEADPIASNNNPIGSAYNRRIEVTYRFA